MKILFHEKCYAQVTLVEWQSSILIFIFYKHSRQKPDLTEILSITELMGDK